MRTTALVRVLSLLACVAALSATRRANAAVFYSSESVSGVTATGVASLNTHLHSTSSLTWTATFDYGLTSSYGSTVAGSTGSNNVPPFFDGNVSSAPISGLTCNTTYHWAVVVAGAHDTDQTFTTSACPAPAIAVSPASGGFGLVALDGTQSLTFTVTNTGTADLAVSGITLGGRNANDFTVSAGWCPSLSPTLAPSIACTVIVEFTPGATGHRIATLQVASNAGTVNVALSGSGAGDASVPTLSEWGTIFLTLAFAVVLALRAKDGVTPV